MRVVVTGGAGFIGSHLLAALVSAGHEVLVVDDLSKGSAEHVPARARLEVRDILAPGLEAVLSAFGPDRVVHLAAQTSVQVSVEDPEHDWRVNVEGTRAVAAAAVAAGARRVLLASSAAVYGEPVEVPLKETSRMEPSNPYGRSKLAAEGVLAETLSETGVDHASLRLANVYGPGQDAAGEGGVVAIFCDRASRGDVLRVYGDGSQTRDFVFVTDVASALLGALEKDSYLSADAPLALNISTGIETPVLQVASLVAEAAGVEIGVRHEPARPCDVARSALDASRAEATLGWRATTPLADGIGETVSWFKAR